MFLDSSLALIYERPKDLRDELIDIYKDELVMDFVLEQGEQDIHVLNAISPAFTSSMAFAGRVADLVVS
jgi:hypothetical protein